VGAARVRVVAAVTGLTGAEGEWKPDAETWSIGENVEHLVLAEYSGINRMWRAVEAVRRGRGRGRFRGGSEQGPFN